MLPTVPTRSIAPLHLSFTVQCLQWKWHIKTVSIFSTRKQDDGLSDGEGNLAMGPAIFIQSRRVTDRMMEAHMHACMHVCLTYIHNTLVYNTHYWGIRLFQKGETLWLFPVLLHHCIFSSQNSIHRYCINISITYMCWGGAVVQQVDRWTCDQ